MMRMTGIRAKQQVCVLCCWLRVVKTILCHMSSPLSKTTLKVLIGGSGMLPSWLLVRHGYWH